jgi:hypothetical protein
MDDPAFDGKAMLALDAQNAEPASSRRAMMLGDSRGNGVAGCRLPWV